MLGFFTAKGEGFFADYSVAVEEFEAAIVLGEAFAGDLDAFDIDFDFVVALHVARKECEIGVGGVGSGGAGEELALEGGGNGGVEDGIFAIVLGVVAIVWVIGLSRSGNRDFGGFELVSGEFGVAPLFKALEGGDVGFDAKAVGGWLSQFFPDFVDRHFEKPVVDLIELFGGKGG